MSFIVTPGQLHQRGELYHQLGILLSAGISMPQALEQAQRNPPSRSMREPISEWIGLLRSGLTVSDAVGQMGSWIPSFDAALIEAGDRSGRLDACFKLLAIYYQDRSRMARQVISDLMYPALMFHFAILMFPCLELFKGGGLFYFFCSTAGVLVPLYAGILFLIYACQGRHGEAWRSRIEQIVRPIPVLGDARRKLALARLAAALEALITAGVSIVDGWELAATASGSTALRRVVLTWKEPLKSGVTPGELVSMAPEFPEMFANFYNSGEISGKLDEMLRRLHTIYQDEGSRKLHVAAQWTPKIVYFVVVLIVGWKIIHFYSGYNDELNQIMDMK